MKTQKEIKEKIRHLSELLDKEENKSQIQQCKLWSAIDYLTWVLNMGE